MFIEAEVMSDSLFYEPKTEFIVEFSVTLPSPNLLVNQPPIVSEQVNSVKVLAGTGQSQVIVVGKPLDMQLDPVYLGEWGFSSKPKGEVEDPEWITFKN